MIITHRIALDPNTRQETLLRQHAGYARFAWNWGVEESRRALDAEPSVIAFDGGCLARWFFKDAEVEVPARGRPVGRGGSVLPVEQDVFVVWVGERRAAEEERWCCPGCGASHHRDDNAALNLRRHGLASDVEGMSDGRKAAVLSEASTRQIIPD